MSNTEVRKVFFYDKEEDSDIQEWIESLPARSQSEYIRKAIRTMIALEKSSNAKIEEANKLEERVSHLEKELSEIKTYLINNPHGGERNDSPDQGNERKFVDASHIIKNLGK